MARAQREADPMTQVRDLAAALDRGELARAYLLRGEERYFRARALARIRAAAEKAGQEFCLHDTDDPDFALARLTDDLVGGGLFAASRLVVARNPDKLLKKTDGKDSTLTRAAIAWLESGEPGCLVISARSLRADHALAKAIAKAGGATVTSRRLWDSPPPWGNPDPRRAELVLWLVGRAREMGVKLSPGDGVYVAAATGNDLFALEDQLVKLREAPGGDLHALVGWSAAAAPWSVAEALVDGDLPRALGGVETLFRGGFEERDGRRLVEPIALATILVASLQGAVRKGLALATELERGATPEAAATRAGVSGAPSTVQAQVARARRRTPVRWRSMLDDAAALERKAKSGGVDAPDFAALALRWADKAEAAAR